MHTVNPWQKLSLLCCVVHPTICITKYSENDLLFLRPFCTDLRFIVLGALLRQHRFSGWKRRYRIFRPI